MQRFFKHIFAYYDTPLPIGSYEIIKRLQLWLKNAQCGHKEGPKIPNFFGEITIKAGLPKYIHKPLLSQNTVHFT